MSLDDFSLNEADKSFFKEASNVIYNWLSPEKRLKFSQELATEGLSNIEDLKEKERFFRLLHFLEVNYIKVVEWAGKTLESLNAINKSSKNPVKDIKLELTEQEGTSFSEIFNDLSESKIKTLFYSTLDQLEISSEYKKQLFSKKEAENYE